MHHSLHDLTSGVKDNIHQRIQGRVRIRLLRQSLTNTLAVSCLLHVLCEVADNRAHASDFLDNVSEVVDDKVECFAALSDGPEEAIYGAYDVCDGVADQRCCVADCRDEKRVEIEGIEDAADDVDEVTFYPNVSIPKDQ